MFDDSFRDLRPSAQICETVESGSRQVRSQVRSQLPSALRIDLEGVNTLIFDNGFKDLKPPSSEMRNSPQKRSFVVNHLEFTSLRRQFAIYI